MPGLLPRRGCAARKMGVNECSEGSPELGGEAAFEPCGLRAGLVPWACPPARKVSAVAQGLSFLPEDVWLSQIRVSLFLVSGDAAASVTVEISLCSSGIVRALGPMRS